MKISKLKLKRKKHQLHKKFKILENPVKMSNTLPYRLLATKDPRQKSVEDLFETIFSTGKESELLKVRKTYEAIFNWIIFIPMSI